MSDPPQETNGVDGSDAPAQADNAGVDDQAVNGKARRGARKETARYVCASAGVLICESANCRFSAEHPSPPLAGVAPRPTGKRGCPQDLHLSLHVWQRGAHSCRTSTHSSVPRLLPRDWRGPGRLDVCQAAGPRGPE